MSFVVGTAGHIDHGKSTLITALTGIDPDRLAEEKRRGMTIDLGFAHMTLPSGREVGIVDVPGHARFMRNMLAGAHGLDAALLVVAADEGLMPQTREHLDVLDLLEVKRGLVVLTKRDLVEADWLALVEQEVVAALRGTSLEGARAHAVSALTGEGLTELVAALDALLDSAEPRPDVGRPRLPIDRVFLISGFGTVVTGTLVDGSIKVGDELEVVPGARRVRVRGLQRHNEKVERAGPGNRVAANLGGVEKSDLAPGDVLAAELRKYPRGVTVAALLKATTAVHADVDRLHARRVGDWIFSDEAWRSIASRAGDELAAYHQAYPFRAGMAREELRSKLSVSAASFPAVVQGLVEDGRLVERNGSLSSPAHSVALDTESGPAQELMRVLAEQPFAPPSLSEAAARAGASEELVRALALQGDIVRVADDVAFSRDAYESAVALVKEIVAASGSVTVAQLRDRMGASRRPVLALLEHLDARRVTRRVGDARVLR